MKDTKLVSGFPALSHQIGVPARTLKSLWHQRKFSGIRAGHRTLLFHPDKVLAELERLTIKAVS